MIKVLGGQKAPRKAWERLTESHPEVVLKCHNLLFPGPGQRETPVAKDKIQKADPDVLAKCEDFLFPGQGQKAAPIARTKEDAYYILGLPLLLDPARLDPLHRKPFQHFGVFCRPACVSAKALPDGAFSQPSDSLDGPLGVPLQ